MGKKQLIIVAIALAVVISILAIFRLGKQAQAPAISADQTRLARVIIHESGFEPAVLTIKQGTRVEWFNEDEDHAHQISANPYPTGDSLKELHSQELQESEQSYSYTFSKTGTFKYHDRHNPKLNGTIIVE
jgi:plastocyanin